MRNHKLDRMCAKRLKAPDFAQEPQYKPTSKLEITLVILLVLASIVLFALDVYKVYYA